MRRLTFPGYLERYVRALSFGNTNSIFKLVKEVDNKHHRLREPLFLYALSTGKTNLLLRASKGSELYSLYSAMADSYSWESMLCSLECKDNSLDVDYHKVYSGYKSRRNMPETDSDTKSLMFREIKRLQNEKKLSNYRLYTDLQLNPSNTNSFLKHGDVRKVSLKVARKMLAYVEGA